MFGCERSPYITPAASPQGHSLLARSLRASLTAEAADACSDILLHIHLDGG